MRVLNVTYYHPFFGNSGVSMYCRDVLPLLAERGVEIGALCVHERNWHFRPYVQRTQHDGIPIRAIVNSPLDPDVSLNHPSQDVRQPAIEALFRATLNEFRPQVLHIQTLHGYPGSILAIAKELAIPTVVTLHDFWAICPRVILVRPQPEASCDGPEGGLNCIRYCVRPQSWRQRVYRFGTHLPQGRSRQLFYGARGLYQRLVGPHGTSWVLPAESTAPDLRLLSEHAIRSKFLVRALGDVDQLLAVSEFTKGVFVRHGIPPTHIRLLSPSLALRGRVSWKIRSVTGPQVRFGFLGRAVHLKGAHVFAEAAREIPPDRARFLLFGPVSPEAQRYLRQLAGSAHLEFRGPYQRDELGKVLDEVDVVVVPSVAQETVGLVTVEAHAGGVPVVGSRIGAIPEFIRDEDDGLLFTPGNAQDLREKLLRFIDNPVLVTKMSARTRPPIPIGDHIDALVALYQSLAQKGREPAWSHSSA